MRLKAWFSNGLLALASGLLAALLIEGILRLADYHFSPIVFLRPEAAGDWRPYHMQPSDGSNSGTTPITVFDPVLLWRLNPRASSQIDARGYRGSGFSGRKGPDDFLIVALGDSNTLGPLDTVGHWPGFLQSFVDRNPSSRRIRIVNASVYGYTSFQGLRRLAEVFRDKPDLVFFSFGANDAHPVRITDRVYAGRVEWLQRWASFRLLPPVSHVAWFLVDRVRQAPVATHRVPLTEYRENLIQFVSQTKAHGAMPVLLTRPCRGSSADPSLWLTYAPPYNDVTREVAADTGVDCIDVEREFRQQTSSFVDDSHFTRGGYVHMAEFLMSFLRSKGLIGSTITLAPECFLSKAADTDPELDDGWWAREEWGTGPLAGRWTRDEATIHLRRRGQEGVLLIDLNAQNPSDRTTGRIEANGTIVHEMDYPNGPVTRRIDISHIPGSDVTVRFVIDTAFVPAEEDTAAKDARLLGVFVRRVELIGDHPEDDRRAP